VLSAGVVLTNGNGGRSAEIGQNSRSSSPQMALVRAPSHPVRRPTRALRSVSGDDSDTLLERHRKVLTELEPLNVEARYPTHRDALLKELTKRYCTGLLGRALRLTAWIARRL